MFIGEETHSEKIHPLTKVTQLATGLDLGLQTAQTGSLHHPTQPPLNKGQHHKATHQVTDPRVTGGRKGQYRSCKNAELGEKNR